MPIVLIVLINISMAVLEPHVLCRFIRWPTAKRVGFIRIQGGFLFSKQALQKSPKTLLTADLEFVGTELEAWSHRADY